jgi:hypothetical protein
MLVPEIRHVWECSCMLGDNICQFSTPQAGDENEKRYGEKPFSNRGRPIPSVAIEPERIAY